MAEILDKDLNKIENILNESMNDLLYGGNGDPGDVELAAAAACFKCLKILNLKIKDEKNIRATLEGENVHSYNYMVEL
jgi:hypothetical protein